MARKFKKIRTGRFAPRQALYPNGWPPNLRASLYANHKAKSGLDVLEKIYFPINHRTLWAGDSIAARRDFRSLAAWSVVYQPRLQYSAKPSGDFFFGTEAVGGDTTAQFLTRLPDIFTQHPDLTHLFFNIGTNDLGDVTTATAVENIEDAIDLIRAEGITPVWLEILPRQTGNEQRLEIIEEVKRIKNARGDFFSISCEDVFDPFDSTHTLDGLHPTPLGASLICREMARYFSFDGGIENYLPTNRMSNPEFLGNSGNVNGTFSAESECPDDYYVQNETDIVATSEIVEESGFRKVRFTMVGESTTDNWIMLRRVESGVGALVGEIHEGKVEFEITASDGESNPVGVESFQIRFENSRCFYSSYDPDTNGIVPAFKGTLRSLPQLVGSEETSLNFQFQLWVPASTAVDVQFTLFAPWAGNHDLD